jgi:hypothetical protein
VQSAKGKVIKISDLTTMNFSTVISLLFYVVGVHSSVAKKVINSGDTLAADSKAAQELIASSRSLEDYTTDPSFLTTYSIKFQDCHHVTQWNGEDDDDEDVKIITRRLVRYRLCPSYSCKDKRSSGCTSKYGDFLVDLNTFMSYYLEMMEDEAKDCDYFQAQCEKQCSGSGDDDASNCYESCYALSGCDNDDDGIFNPLDYATCAAYDDVAGDDGEGSYLGPVCSDDGSHIHLELFSDDTCNTLASCDSSCYAQSNGYSIPFSSTSMISTNCVSCAEEDDDLYYYGSLREECYDLYTDSGKCETRMAIDYPNESACTYIEGIKFIGDNGVIDSPSVRRSKTASVIIGISSGFTILLIVYVQYLSTKLDRARFNLSRSRGAVL